MKSLSLLAVVIAVLNASSAPLSISLHTAWPAPPIVLEILEVVYDEEPSSYLPLLQLLLSSDSEPSSSPQTLLADSLTVLESHDLLPKPSSLSTLNLALSLHTAAPRIEAHYSWYESTLDELVLGVQGCGSWVDWRGKGFCDVERLKKDMELSIEEGAHDESNNITTLPFDRIFPSSTYYTSTAVFYSDPTTPRTGMLLDYLIRHATRDPSFSFVVRYRPPLSSPNEGVRRNAMTGYGVEMVLKNTDYLVVDDRGSTGDQSHGSPALSAPDNRSEGIFSDVFGDEVPAEVISPLTKVELKDIGLRAASLVMSSEEPLEALFHLSQDFPKYSAILARKVEVAPAIRKKTPDLIQRGNSPATMYINGKGHSETDVNPYSLLKIIRAERDLVLSLTKLGLTPRQAYELLSDPMIGEAQTIDDPGEGVVDASDRAEGGGIITWWNDIEKDSRYKQWPVHVQGYLRPLYPGQLHTIRRNTWNLVFALDLSLAPSLEVMASSMGMMIQRGLPIRFGVVPMLDANIDDMSLRMAKILKYAVTTFGRAQTLEMFRYILAETPGTPAAPGIIKLETVRKAFKLIATGSVKPILPFDEVVDAEWDENQLAKLQNYSSRLLATREELPTGHLFINGKHFAMGGQWTAIVQQELTLQLSHLQKQLATGSIDPDDISTFFYDLPTTANRRSKLLIPSLGNKLQIFNLLDVFDGEVAKRLTSDMLYPIDESRGAPMTMWLIGDLDSADSRSIVESALNHLQSPACSSRLGFVHVPDSSKAATTTPFRLSTILYQYIANSNLGRYTAAGLLEWIRGIEKLQNDCEDPNCHRVEFFTDEMLGDDANPTVNVNEGSQKVFVDAEMAAEFWKVGSHIAAKLGLKSREPHLLVNGRLVGPISPKSFPAEDFHTMEAYEHRKRVKPVIDTLRTMYDDMTAFDRATLADLISKASSIVASAYKSAEAEEIFTSHRVARTRYFERLDGGELSFILGKPETAILHVAAVLDPISEAAQKWSSLLKMLFQMENVAVSVYLQPNPAVGEITLKRFYRYAISAQPSFDVDGNQIAHGVTFDGLPSAPIFTLGMDTPPAWLVRPETSPYDLDNLVLGSIREPAHIAFSLNQLLIEGHAREANNAPPRGLQLQLTAKGLEEVSDTQVMANLGYIQFKLTPGVYDLAIRSGRGTDVYEMESVGGAGWDTPGVNLTGTSVGLTSFEGVTIFPRFTRKPGMELENVLIEEQRTEPTSMAQAVFSKMKSMVGLSPAGTSSKPATRHADVNIFTVASGLLYERFASIMILSVMKNTQGSVKFWFIENFLSPTFLEFVPKMAEEYHFEYEFVTYKWPHWLRAQTEKQRIIWAYKILFLDVLFPMDLDKVIFVDADQIVRVDMKQLVDVDLQGHAYGYAPMGDDREEMEGFRFWKTGYWKEALRGRPYHISALYVVDLKRFRQLATGDRLRGQYHALSADPNSLANLDQDLPNSMQDQIPIFTLDQSWLWCQTWCSDESLARAKTIDLCQNPLTKEPKLVRARQIPEWDVYDREIAAFAARTTDQDSTLAVDVDELAAGHNATAETDQKVDGETGETLMQGAGVVAEEALEEEGRIIDEL